MFLTDSATIDRIRPTQRPLGKARGYQRWRSLLFLHWAIEPDAVRAVLPKGLALDLYESTADVGVVAFGMEGVRPRFLPEALAFEFLETNVRTYVHVRGEDPGVYFFSLDAASRLAVAGARIGWGLPYFFSEMRLVRSGDQLEYELRRQSGKRPRFFARYALGDLLGASAPGTLEHFLAERYLLHVERRGRIYTGQVHHVPYPLQRAHLLEIEDDLVAAAGLPRPVGPPPLVHYASGVDVEVFDLAPRIPAI